MRAVPVAIAGAAGFLLATGWVRPAAAQEPASPAPPVEQEDAGLDRGSGQPDAVPAPQPQWSLSLRLQEVRDTNPDLRPGETEGSWATSLSGGVSRAIEGRHSRHLFSAGADFERYHQLHGMDQVRWAGAAASELRLSLRTRLDVAASITSTRARDLQPLLDEGLLLPAVPVRRVAESAELSRRLSAVTNLSAWAKHQRVTFDSEAFADGSEWAVGATLGRRLGRRHAVSLSYSLNRSASGIEAGSFHEAALSWKGPLAARLSADASVAGVLWIGDETDRAPDLEGGAGMEYRLKDVGFSARYTRTVGQAFGFGVPHLSDVGAVGLDWKPVKAIVMAFSSSLGWSRPTTGATSDVRSRTLAADVRWSPTRLLTVASGYSWFRRSASHDGPVSTDQVWKTSLSLGRSWP